MKLLIPAFFAFLGVFAAASTQSQSIWAPDEPFQAAPLPNTVKLAASVCATEHTLEAAAICSNETDLAGPFQSLQQRHSD